MIKAWDTLDAIERHPDIVSGAWVFRGTRVPVAALFENLRDGATIDQFPEWVPGVMRTQVEAVLNDEVQTLATATAVCGSFSIRAHLSHYGDRSLGTSLRPPMSRDGPP